jgi:archaetidylinositol phosphate synthase
MAEVYGKKTRLGGFIDSVFDRYSDATVTASLIIGGLCDMHWGLAALVGSFLVSYIRAKAESLGVDMASVGLAERAERMIVIGFFSLLNYFFAEALNYGVMLLAVLTNYTAMQRIVYFYKKTKSSSV